MGSIVTLGVPKNLSDVVVKGILDSKRSWILSKLKKEELRSPKKRIRYISGESVSYLGRKYPLRISYGLQNALSLKEGKFEFTIFDRKKSYNDTVKKLMFAWYQGRARRLLVKKTKIFSESMGVSPQSITVKDYKSRWGACSIKGHLFFNWRIIMAPIKIIDYLVVHELCHLLEYNHSKNFWNHVSNNCVHYEKSRKWLKEFGKEFIEM
jgi:Predicted metal-dependent hydrolase